MVDERYERGVRLLESLAPGQTEILGRVLADIAPDMLEFTVAFGYGDVLSRQGLDLKTRQAATVAALAAMGTARAQLVFHVGAALNAGLDAAEVVEIIYLVAVFAGFPAALNAVSAAREAFEAKGVTPRPAGGETTGNRRERGLAALEATSKGAGQAVLNSLADIAPDLAGFILDFSYGDVISRGVLKPRLKEVSMIAAAAARGTMLPQLKVHVAAGLAVGLSRTEIAEVLIQMAVYAGFPAALNALFAAKEVFEAA